MVRVMVVLAATTALAGCAARTVPPAEVAPAVETATVVEVAPAPKLTDPHSPSEQRSAVVRNLDPWYPAFNVQPGQKLYLPPPDRVRIW